MTSNSVTGLISIVFGAVYLFMTLRLPDVSVGDPIGPKLFPLLVGLGALLCGILLVVNEIRVNRAARNDVITVDLSSRRELYGKIGLTILAGIIYGFLLDPVGYLISTFVFMTFILSLVNSLKRMVENIALSLGFSVTTYVVFAILLKLSLPRGVLSLFF